MQSLDKRPEQFHCPMTRKHHSAEGKICTILMELRREESVSS